MKGTHNNASALFSSQYPQDSSKHLQIPYQQFSSNKYRILAIVAFFFLGLILSYFFLLYNFDLLPTERNKLIASITLDAFFLFAFSLVICKAGSSSKFFPHKDKVMIILTISTIVCNIELYWISNEIEPAGIVVLFILALLPSTMYIKGIDKFIHGALVLGYYSIFYIRMKGSLLPLLVNLNVAVTIILYLQFGKRTQKEYWMKCLNFDLLLQVFNLTSAHKEKIYMVVDKDLNLIFANNYFYNFFKVNSSSMKAERVNELLKEIVQVTYEENLTSIIEEQDSQYAKRNSLKGMKPKETDKDLMKKTSITKGQAFKSLINDTQDDSLKTILKFFFEQSGMLKQINIGWNSELNIPVFFPAVGYYEAKKFFLQLAYINFCNEDLILIEFTRNECPTQFTSTPSNLSMTDIASIIHEIRTPLNGTIFLLMQSLQDGSIPSQIKTELLVPSVTSAKRLWYIVNDLLDFAQILEGKFRLSLETFDLSSALNQSLQIIAALGKAKGLEVYLEIDPLTPKSITTDQNRLVQIIYNLMGNAIKFTKQGYIKLIVGPSSEFPNFIDFAVEDTGYGIREEDLNKLFKVFEKLDNWQDNRIGSGLGLCIGNALAKALGQSITVTSQYKKGSVFKFSIENKDKNLPLSTNLITSPKKLDMTLEHIQRVPDLELLEPRSKLYSFDEGRPKSSIEITSIFDAQRLGFHFMRRESNEIKIETPDTKNSKTVHFDFSSPSTNILSTSKKREDTYRIRVDPGDYGLKEDDETTDFAFINRSNSGMPFLSNKLDYSNMTMLSPGSSVGRCSCIKVLGVDDEPVNTFTLQLALKGLRLAAKFFTSGDDLIDFLTSNQDSLVCNHCKGPLFILMDCYMPVKDGFQTTDELISLMKQDQIIKIPIVACTADESELINFKVKEHGMNERAPKPLTTMQLEILVHKYTLFQHFGEMDEVSKERA